MKTSIFYLIPISLCGVNVPYNMCHRPRKLQIEIAALYFLSHTFLQKYCSNKINITKMCYISILKRTVTNQVRMILYLQRAKNHKANYALNCYPLLWWYHSDYNYTKKNNSSVAELVSIASMFSLSASSILNYCAVPLSLLHPIILRIPNLETWLSIVHKYHIIQYRFLIIFLLS